MTRRFASRWRSDLRCCGGRADRPQPSVPAGRGANERLAEDADDRGRRDGRHEPPARDARRRAGARAWGERGRRCARCRGRALRRRADGDGIGGDAFAIVWRDGHLQGLNGSGALAGRARLGPRRLVRPAVGHRARCLACVGRPRGALRPPGPRRGDRSRRRPRRARARVHGTDRRQVGAGGAGAVAGAGDRRAVLAARARCDAPSSGRWRAGRVLLRAGRRGDRRGLLALRGRPRGARVRVGGAAATRLPRSCGLRAAAERAGRGCTPRARDLRGARARACTPGSSR